MSTYYYQGAAILAPFTITSNEPMFDMTTVALTTQRASQGYQRWELTFGIVAEPSNQTDVFLSSFQNLETAGTMIMPQLPSVTSATNYVQSTSGATVTTLSLDVGVSATAGAYSVTVSNNNGSGGAACTGVLPKGSFIKFSNHDKLYIVTADTTFPNTINNQTISIYPKLKTNLTTSHSMKAKDSTVLTYFRSIDNATGITFSDGVLSNIGTVNLIEAI